MSYAQDSSPVSGKEEGRLELLLFSLGNPQYFGINVLKVREIIARPPLTVLPHAHPCVIGVAQLRNEVLPVLDLSLALGRGRLPATMDGALIITELNRSLQALLIGGVYRIVEREWKAVLPPPKGSRNTYISGVTDFEDHMVQVLDVERVLWEVMPSSRIHGEEELKDLECPDLRGTQVMVVDDSSIARMQTKRILENLGFSCILAQDGREALEYLKALAAETSSIMPALPVVISDIEMPEMDGYTLSREIRNDPKLADLYILLHTSLNGSICEKRAMNAGADAALTKFVPEYLARATITGLRAKLS